MKHKENNKPMHIVVKVCRKALNYCVPLKA